MGVIKISLLQAIILGIVQGLTEFLPISSSAHLVFVPTLLGIPYPPLVFDVLLHLGTLAAVIFHFREDLKSLLTGFFRGEEAFRRLVWWLILGTIPAVIGGVVFHDVLEEFFSSPVFPAIFLLVTGAFLWTAERVGGEKDYTALGPWGALLVGFFQALSLLPGISRSGATLTAGRWWGLSRQEAARFSFLLSIPIILGVGAYESLPLLAGEAAQPAVTLPYLGGTLAAAVSGFLVIRFFLHYLRKGSLRPFIFYCWAVGVIFLVKTVLG